VCICILKSDCIIWRTVNYVDYFLASSRPKGIEKKWKEKESGDKREERGTKGREQKRKERQEARG
jgi:hypothetical protein